VLEHDYPISAIDHDTPRYPLGAAVLPGVYKVVLTAAHETYSQTINIKMDPRVKTSRNDLTGQFELDRKIADALHKDYGAVQEVRSLRAQLKPLTALDTKNAKRKAITKTAADLEAKSAALEGEEGARYLSTPEGRTLVRLNGGLGTLLNGLDTADAAPTTQQSAIFVELEKAWQEQLAAWSDMKSKDVSGLNEQLKKARLPAIDLQKPVRGAEDSAETTSQDRDRNEE
jgi:hypothetical protein